MATTKKASTKTTSGPGFTDEERAAMKERAEELKASGRGGAKKADNLKALLAKIEEMPDSDRVMAERIHAIVTRVAPDLDAKTWYGMPAYADKDGKVVCFFKAADKFGDRYATLGFEASAKIDEGSMWPTSYALTELTDADAQRVEDLVKRAVS
ncbi:DUF1801 domain-containing protein [Mumia zhuanghuii]|uniref:Iron chaperone n=2 Tax=Mumia TaxID=1546255 RepID=A0ABW1QHW7_9ACTN|nr:MULTISPECIES: DUF1801 domain-containing protein [Mumia]KAA1424786.1 DUF1801 domain-containing protein [Mumia zhuanghuii]